MTNEIEVFAKLAMAITMVGIAGLLGILKHPGQATIKIRSLQIKGPTDFVILSLGIAMLVSYYGIVLVF